MSLDRQVVRGLALAWAAVVVLALLSGPLYMLVTWVIYVKMEHLPSYGEWDWSILELFLMVGVAAVTLTAPVAACIAIGIGAPLFGVMFKSGVRSTLGYALAGLLISLLAASLLFLVHNFRAFLVHEDFIFALSLIGIAGPISGVMFSWGATRARPKQGLVI